MRKIKTLIFILTSMLFLVQIGFSTQEQIRIDMQEYVNQNVVYNPLKSGSNWIWNNTNENQTSYVLTGYLTVTNNNPNGKTMSDIYISFDYTTNITLPTNIDGRSGTFVSSDPTTNTLVLHVPELMSGENSTWIYSINTSNIRPPLNFTSVYTDTKVLAGQNTTITDTVYNSFDNAVYQSNTCIYDINITQTTTPVNFSGIMEDYLFLTNSTTGSDSGNVIYSSDNLTQYWNVLNNSCLNKGSGTDITYDVLTPLNIPKTTHYSMINSTLKYKLNATVSHLRVVDITAVSEATIDFEKRIMYPSHTTLYGSNVTWNVTGYFNTNTNITYNLTSFTLWVAQRVGSLGDPNTIDNDTINTSKPLYTSSSPFVLVNSTAPWSSSTWLFNYSDVPSPIVWMDVNFTIQNDGNQLINKSISQNGKDIYIKELYLIIGYWLEINKNITAINNDTYHVRIDVHNKGNQVTPADTIVTIYDFIPSSYNLNGTFIYANSGWYNTDAANYSINGTYNGTLHQWGLNPTNIYNTSFSQGPAFNENTTWSVDYNVTGFGDYELMDVFVTGLDPQKVDGAGSTNSVVVNEIVDRIKSTEGIFAAIASVLLLLGLLL